MNHYIKIILLFALLSTIVFSKDDAFTNGIISEDIRHELNTQEIILERIIKHYDKNRIISHKNVVSYYINNYGALFEIQRFPVSEIDLFKQFGETGGRSKTKYVWSDEKNAIVKYKSRYSREDSLRVIKMVDEYLQDLHLAIFEFFADYICKVNWLKNNEKVFIHFDINLYGKIPKEYDRAMVENIIPIALQASVTAIDLYDFQKGNLTIEQFDGKIKIDKIMVDPQLYNSKILGDVIESSVESIKSENDRPFSLYTTSFTVPELGNIYFLATQYRSRGAFYDVGSFLEYLFGANRDKEKHENETNGYDKLMHKFKFRLIKVLAQYGHKLKNVKDRQWVILLVNIGHQARIKSRFVMKVLKKDIDAVANNMISFEEFSDNVHFFDEEINY